MRYGPQNKQQKKDTLFWQPLLKTKQIIVTFEIDCGICLTLDLQNVEYSSIPSKAV